MTEKYEKILREKVSDLRFTHCKNVSKEAEKLARKYGIDENKAKLAGLLHDIMKDTPYNEQINFLKFYGIDLIKQNEFSENLYHALSGTIYVKNILKITDEDILNAIRYHTTGRQNMSLLEKVIFVSDFISEDRTFNGVEELRDLAKKDINLAALEGTKFTIEHLASKCLFIHPDTLFAYNELIQYKKGDY